MITRYIYSACIVIETQDISICCDPWFTQGIYDGAWYQYPRVQDPVRTIGPVDFIYVSHIHPDHYDPPILREILEANPSCEVLIGDENQSFLESKMRRDGFKPQKLSRQAFGATEIGIFPNRAGSEINIDSALVVKDAESVVVNMNDCPFDDEQIGEIKEFCGTRPDLACLPYAGAGPYPQAYRFDNELDRISAADAKKEQFLALFGKYFQTLNPRLAMPFAGLYYLGGNRRWMNHSRGVPDAVEVVQRFGSSVIVLEEGIGTVNLRTREVRHQRILPHDHDQRDAYLSTFDGVAFPYMIDESISEADLISKLRAAHLNACQRIGDKPQGWIFFKTPSTRFLGVHANRPGEIEVHDSLGGLEPREEIFIDGRLLAGLLERRYHWNNAEIGSHFEFRRVAQNYDRRVYDLLNFLHV